MERTTLMQCTDGTERKVPLLSVSEVVALEQRIAEGGTSLLELMKRAGQSLADEVLKRNLATEVVILAGSGNNGGDGWVAAHILAAAGSHVTVITKAAPEALQAEPARTAALEATASGAFAFVIDPSEEQLEELLRSAAVIVDAILGTGFAHNEVREPYVTWILRANAANHDRGTPIVSADCPSGLNANTGTPAAQCIVATTTVTMLAPKTGLLEPQAQPYIGHLVLAPLTTE